MQQGGEREYSDCQGSVASAAALWQIIYITHHYIMTATI
jgi:hypothetical protein